MAEPIDVEDLPRSDRIYTEEEKRIRDKFIFEYMRDNNLYAAGVRMGYSGQNAMDFAKTLLDEPYVASRLVQLRESGYGMVQAGSETANGMNLEAEEAIRQRIINGLMREAFDYGQGTKQQARISALNKLAEIYKVGQDTGNNLKTNVMVVPAMGSVDTWEQTATAQQAQLKNEVRH
ncbi:MAG: hypothetical protein ACRDCY_18060 [Aeromonas veronii]